MLLLSSCVLLVLALLCVGWTRTQCVAPVPKPSLMGGYYEEPFTLELSAPQDGQIYYTTDGSTPTTDSSVYRGGIRIENRSSEPNRYHSVLQVQRDWHWYQPDTTPVEKGTVLRAIFVNAGGIQSDVFTQTYFVGISPPPPPSKDIPCLSSLSMTICSAKMAFTSPGSNTTNGISPETQPCRNPRRISWKNMKFPSLLNSWTPPATFCSSQWD